MTNQIVICGDNIDVLKTYSDNYFDAVVTDPPYGLGKEPNAEELMKDWIEHGYHEISGSGFMGKKWDAFVPQPLFWKEVFRVLKHGGHVVAFYGTRTYDWGVMSMRFAGFEVRDCIQWIYGSGFPKSYNISKGIDKIYGAEREITGSRISAYGDTESSETDDGRNLWGKKSTKEVLLKDKPSTKEADIWEGWGSALKPANEPIVLARKPLEKGLSIAENVLKWGTGGINIDGCRVGYNQVQINANGRFPANIILTHHPECECKGLKKVGSGKEGGYNYQGSFYDVDGFIPKNSPIANSNYGVETIEAWECHPDCPIKIMDEQSGISKTGDIKPQGDMGGASRFFYCAKASKSERNKGLKGFEEKRPDERDLKGMDTFEEKGVAKQSNFHPTVKPVKLMQYLIRLITPPNGKVLDPFCGSGTTGIACKLEGFEFVGIEQDAEYIKIAQARIDNYKEEA